jgi:hypothetical protein
MLSSMLDEMGARGERLRGYLPQLARATPGFLASDLALLITRLLATQQDLGTVMFHTFLCTYGTKLLSLLVNLS